MIYTHIVQAGCRDTVRIVSTWARSDISARKDTYYTVGVITIFMRGLGTQAPRSFLTHLPSHTECLLLRCMEKHLQSCAGHPWCSKFQRKGQIVLLICSPSPAGRWTAEHSVLLQTHL